ncbi:MAG: hypothetical protein AAF542_17775 [Pseudomonadota bacterium]
MALRSRIDGNPVPVGLWTQAQGEKSVKVAEKALWGVGVSGKEHFSKGSITFVARRLCTDEERSRVQENYLQ